MTGDQPAGDPGAAQPEAGLEVLAEELYERAAAYGMRTDVTDWTKVATIARRNRQAAARLVAEVDGQPLRATPAETQ